MPQKYKLVKAIDQENPCYECHILIGNICVLTILKSIDPKLRDEFIKVNGGHCSTPFVEKVYKIER